MPLGLQYDVLNDTPASASPIEANYNRIEQYVNQEVITRDGVTAMVAQLQLVGNPINDLDAAPKQYVDQVLPVGIIMMYGGAAAPPGGRWAVCNGAEVESTIYPVLFTIIANSYSPAGTPAGRFHLPNLADRFAMGQGAIAGIGASGGSANGQVPAHSHTIDHGHAGTGSGWDSPDHAHLGIDHLHRVDIWSGGQNANHYHNDQGHGRYVFDGAPFPGGEAYGIQGNIHGRVISFEATTNWAAQDHAHAINGWTGAADRGLHTHGANVRHTHTTSTPAFAGRSGTEGVAATNTNLPPYVGVTYVIRVS